jgi:hypothetical protein
MASPEHPVEHFCTLFDGNFLSYGLCLHESLLRHAQPFHLWIVAMDAEAESRLASLALPQVTVIPLREVEDPRLLAVKPGRTRGEYCWTLTSFVPDAVFARDPAVPRVTYLDADLYFFSSPRRLLAELDAAGKGVLITEHAYAPRYAWQAAINGRFCVQFVTFTRDAASIAVMRWWQDRCLEWCFGRFEDGKFGDQRYLERWPELFPGTVHILARTQLTLAPWNADHAMAAGAGDPVIFHFHGWRKVAADRVLMFLSYRVSGAALRFYAVYREAFARAEARLRTAGMPGAFITTFAGRSRLRLWWHRCRGRASIAALGTVAP